MADVPAQDRKLGLPTIRVKNRHYTKYDPNIALDIVERIAAGELLKDITARDAEAPTIARATFLRWVSTVPELAEAYAAAVRISALSFEEDALDKAKELAKAPGNAQKVGAYNTLISQLRWSAARRDPTKYSDKGNTNIVVPININTSLDLGSGSGKKDAEIPNLYTIDLSKAVDAEFSEVKEEPAHAPIESPEQLKDIVKPGPVERVERQPLLQVPRKVADNTGPRKRVLVPRNSNYTKQL